MADNTQPTSFSKVPVVDNPNDDKKEGKPLSLGEKFIIGVILINSVIIYLQVSGYESLWLEVLDTTCTIIFIIEMVYKLNKYGMLGYWRYGWNRLDGSLVILSLPSLIVLLFPVEGANLSILLAFRLLRTLRVLRIIKVLGNTMNKLAVGFKKGLITSSPVIAAFFVIIVIFGLINCSLFKDVAPEFFGGPLSSIYSVFQLFTIEGWYDIPSACCGGNDSPIMMGFIRLYFCVLLIAGGIIGMSFINSVFVDAMAEDNNDDVKKLINDRIEELTAQNKALEEKINTILKKLGSK